MLRLSAMAASVLALAFAAMPAQAREAGQQFACPGVDAGEIEGNYLSVPVHQGSDGWFFREGSDIAEFFDYGGDTLGYLRRLADTLALRGIKLVYLPVPPKALMQPERLGAADVGAIFTPSMAIADFHDTVASLQQAGITTVDLLAAPDRLPAGADFFFARDFHWRPEGARMAALAVHDALADDPAYQELGKTNYATADLGRAEPFRSAMLQALQRLCSDTLPQEKAELFETTASADSAEDLLGADDLLGDGTTPVALIGTSFSDLDTFNFVGFLQEALGLEVANYAISGGGAFTALESYVHSDSLDEAPPKFLLWENPAYDRLDGDGVNEFRQVIPAIAGYCSGASLIAETKLSIGAGGSASFPVEADGIVGHGYYLAMRAGDSSIRNLSIAIDHANGDGEVFTIARSDRAKPSDRFFVEFSDDIPSPVKQVALTGQPDRQTEFTIQLCKAPEEM